MNNVRLFVASAALAALVASPAMAQRQGIGENAPQVHTPVHPEGVKRGHVTRHHAGSAYRARAQVNSFGEFGSARDAALRGCTELSRKYSESTWGDMQIQQQRACMAAHGQPE
jgi:hypothetical protein